MEELLEEALAHGYSIGVCAKIIGEDGGILLLQRSKDDYSPGVWEMPGGGVEPGEAIIQALAREIREEAGLRLAGTPHYIGHFDFTNAETGRTKRKFCFEATVEGTVQLSAEHAAWDYFSGDEIAAMRVEGDAVPYELFRDHFLLLTKNPPPELEADVNGEGRTDQRQ